MPKYFYQGKEVEVVKITSGGLAQLVDKRWISLAQLQERKDPPVAEKSRKAKNPAPEAPSEQLPD